MPVFRLLLVPLAALLGLLGALAPSPAPRPDEGMWPFHDLPRKILKEKYGFVPTQAWLDHLRLACLKISSGGSGSFVSKDGLVATNHHVSLEFINQLSTQDRDLVTHGFLARTRAEELPIKNATLKQLVSMEDVTSRVRASQGADSRPSIASFKRRQQIARIQAEESRKSGLECQVIGMFGGARYWLYRYKVYKEVRLVFAPEKQVAYFGGDRDNFCYPRYCLDCSFLRAYENGQPAHIENFLRWSPGGVSQGDLIFISGNPASTGRFLTMGRLKFDRDAYLPVVLKLLADREVTLDDYASGSPERKLEVLDEIFGIRNSIKALTGHLKSLRDPAIWNAMVQREAAFKQALQGDQDTLEAFKTIAKGREAWGQAFKALVPERLDGALGSLAEQLTRPRRGEISSKEKAAIVALKLNPDLEACRLGACFETARALLGDDHPFVKLALQDKRPLAAAREAVKASPLMDPEQRRKLLDGGAEALKRSPDRLLKLARMIWQDRRLQGPVIQRARGPEEAAKTRIAQARFRIHGADLYPDATFTLRLSFGVVKGYELGTTDVPWKTTLWGLYARNASFDNRFPYNLPKRWLKARPKLDLNTPMDFVCTADTTGGNSGSPVVDRQGRLVGLLFDGNIQSLLVDNLYSGKVNRSVCVDTRLIAQALDRVFGAQALLKELGLGSK